MSVSRGNTCIIQNAKHPYDMRCRVCGAAWEPKPVTQGPTKGTHTESSLDKSAKDHWATCPGEPPS